MIFMHFSIDYLENIIFNLRIVQNHNKGDNYIYNTQALKILQDFINMISLKLNF